MRLLLVRAGGGMRKAIPLDLVARLEEIAVADVRTSDGRMLVPYRDRLMPLVLAADDMDLPPDGRKPVLVFAETDPREMRSRGAANGTRQMGLVVDAIDDIVESRVLVEIRAGRPDIVGSALVGGVPTEVVDTAYHLTRASADWFRHTAEAEIAARRVLLVDDSGFFRNLITSLLRAAGIEALTAVNGAEALNLLASGPVDLVVTDIDMPAIDGYELARRMRADPRLSRIPIVALSGHNGPRDIARGEEAGFTRHLPKLDRDQLMATIGELLAAETVS
jgi:two-component system chemotaxis sensor kinase CheA